MFHAMILAVTTSAGAQFLQTFSGVWTCGNAS